MFDFLFSGFFWGFILLMFVTGIIIKSVFKIRFSLFFLFLLVVLIFFTVNFFSGSRSESVTFVFSERVIKINDIDEVNIYNNMFCKITYDLTQLETPASEISEMEINNLMGQTRILINKSHKVKIQSRSFFSSSLTPDDNNVVLGNHIYFTGRYSKTNPHIVIDTKCIFGKLEIFEK